MCQLIFIVSKKPKFTKECLALQSIIDTRTTHQDGCGIMFLSSNGDMNITKSITPPSKLDDLVEYFLKDIRTSKPVMFHVRRASEAKKELKIEHAHPFQDEETGLVLAHNGTLEFKDKKRQENIAEEFPEMIDSQRFLSVFAGIYKDQEEKDLPKALNDTMELFKGKFAFLIYDPLTEEHYVVKGKTASLFMREFTLGNDTGYIVNSERDDLLFSTNLLTQLWNLHSRSSLKFSEEIINLEKETIWRATSTGLVKVGEIKENDKYSGKSKSSDAWIDLDYCGYGRLTDIYPSANDLVLRDVYTFLDDYSLTLPEFDVLLYNSMGIGVLEMKEADWKGFKDWVIPKFEQWDRELDREGFMLLGAGRIMWHNICENLKRISYNPLHLYTIFPMLEFPWFINHTEVLAQHLAMSQKIRDGKPLSKALKELERNLTP